MVQSHRLGNRPAHSFLCWCSYGRVRLHDSPGNRKLAFHEPARWVIYSFFAFVLASGVATFTLFLRNWVNDELRDAYWDGKLAERREDMRRRQQNELDATSARDTDAEEPTDEE